MDSLMTYRHNCGLPGVSLQLGAQNNDPVKSCISTEASEWITQIVKAMSAPITCQMVAKLHVNAISMTPSLARDPFFARILSPTEAQSTKKSKLVPEEANKLIVNMLRMAMELQASERLGAYHFSFEG